MLNSHPNAALQPHLKALIPPLLKAVADSYYKISAEALRVVTEVVRVMRTPGVASTFDHKPYVKQLYEPTFGRLKATDTDQEVKDAAINAAGLLISNLGDEVGEKEVKDTLALLVEVCISSISISLEVAAWLFLSNYTEYKFKWFYDFNFSNLLFCSVSATKSLASLP